MVNLWGTFRMHSFSSHLLLKDIIAVNEVSDRIGSISSNSRNYSSEYISVLYIVKVSDCIGN